MENLTVKKSKIPVKIISTIPGDWFHLHKTYEVINRVVYCDGVPMFISVETASNAIPLDSCRVLNKNEFIPEYTMAELEKLVGHPFKLKPV